MARNMLIKKSLLVGLGLAGIAAVAAIIVLTQNGNSKTVAPKEAAAIPVATAQVVNKTVPMRLVAVGNVEAYTTVSVRARVDGQLVGVRFKEGDEVSVGQRVAYVVTTQKSGYLTVFDATPDGKLTQIYPNAASLRSPGSATLASTLIRPGKPILVPDYRNVYRGFDVEIAEPRGKGVMVAMLSHKPLTSLNTPEPPKTFASPEEGVDVIHRLRDELARTLPRDSRSSTATPWSVAYHAYSIH